MLPSLSLQFPAEINAANLFSILTRATDMNLCFQSCTLVEEDKPCMVFLCSRWLCGWAMPPRHHGEQCWHGMAADFDSFKRCHNIKQKREKEITGSRPFSLRTKYAFPAIIGPFQQFNWGKLTTPKDQHVTCKGVMFKGTLFFNQHFSGDRSVLIYMAGFEAWLILSPVLPGLLKAGRDFGFWHGWYWMQKTYWQNFH